MSGGGIANRHPRMRWCSREFGDPTVSVHWRESVPRTPWGRRRTTDSPRPAGRRWAGRLRRSGSLARRVLTVRVGRRHRSGGSVLPGAQDTRDGPSSRLDGSRLIVPADLTMLDVRRIAPVSPAPAGRPTGTVPLLPGAHTRTRQLRFLLVQACTVGSLML